MNENNLDINSSPLDCIFFLSVSRLPSTECYSIHCHLTSAVSTQFSLQSRLTFALLLAVTYITLLCQQHLVLCVLLETLRQQQVITDYAHVQKLENYSLICIDENTETGVVLMGLWTGLLVGLNLLDRSW